MNDEQISWAKAGYTVPTSGHFRRKNRLRFLVIGSSKILHLYKQKNKDVATICVGQALEAVNFLEQRSAIDLAEASVSSSFRAEEQLKAPLRFHGRSRVSTVFSETVELWEELFGALHAFAFGKQVGLRLCVHSIEQDDDVLNLFGKMSVTAALGPLEECLPNIDFQRSDTSLDASFVFLSSSKTDSVQLFFRTGGAVARASVRLSELPITESVTLTIPLFSGELQDPAGRVTLTITLLSRDRGVQSFLEQDTKFEASWLPREALEQSRETVSAASLATPSMLQVAADQSLDAAEVSLDGCGGVFSLLVQRAEGLKNVEKMGKQDPYVSVTLLQSPKVGQSVQAVDHKETKKVRKGGTKPEWTAKHRNKLNLKVPGDGVVTRLLIQLRDWERVGAHKLIGQAMLAIDPKVLAEGTFSADCKVPLLLPDDAEMIEMNILTLKDVTHRGGETESKAISYDELVASEEKAADPAVFLKNFKGGSVEFSLSYSQEQSTLPVVDRRDSDVPVENTITDPIERDLGQGCSLESTSRAAAIAEEAMGSIDTDSGFASLKGPQSARSTHRSIVGDWLKSMSLITLPLLVLVWFSLPALSLWTFLFYATFFLTAFVCILAACFELLLAVALKLFLGHMVKLRSGIFSFWISIQPRPNLPFVFRLRGVEVQPAFVNTFLAGMPMPLSCGGVLLGAVDAEVKLLPLAYRILRAMLLSPLPEASSLVFLSEERQKSPSIGKVLSVSNQCQAIFRRIFQLRLLQRLFSEEKMLQPGAVTVAVSDVFVLATAEFVPAPDSADPPVPAGEPPADVDPDAPIVPLPFAPFRFASDLLCEALLLDFSVQVSRVAIKYAARTAELVERTHRRKDPTLARWSGNEVIETSHGSIGVFVNTLRIGPSQLNCFSARISSPEEQWGGLTAAQKLHGLGIALGGTGVSVTGFEPADVMQFDPQTFYTPESVDWVVSPFNSELHLNWSSFVVPVRPKSLAEVSLRTGPIKVGLKPQQMGVLGTILMEQTAQQFENAVRKQWSRIPPDPGCIFPFIEILVDRVSIAVEVPLAAAVSPRVVLLNDGVTIVMPNHPGRTQDGGREIHLSVSATKIDFDLEMEKEGLSAPVMAASVMTTVEGTSLDGRLDKRRSFIDAFSTFIRFEMSDQILETDIAVGKTVCLNVSFDDLAAVMLVLGRVLAGLEVMMPPAAAEAAQPPSCAVAEEEKEDDGVVESKISDGIVLLEGEKEPEEVCWHTGMQQKICVTIRTQSFFHTLMESEFSPDLKLSMIDDRFGFIKPVVSFQLHLKEFLVDWEDEEVAMKSHFFHEQLSTWEPLLEPWGIYLLAYYSKTTQFDVRLSANSLCNLNVSGPLLNVALKTVDHLMEALMPSVSGVPQLKVEPPRPQLQVKNHLAVPLEVIPASTNDSLLVPPLQSREIPVVASLLHPESDPDISSRTMMEFEQGQHSSMVSREEIGIHIGGEDTPWDEFMPFPIHTEEKCRLFRLVPRGGAEAHSDELMPGEVVACEIQNELGARTISIRSNFTIKNSLSTAIELGSVNVLDMSDDVRVIALLKPGDDCCIAQRQVREAKLVYRPVQATGTAADVFDWGDLVNLRMLISKQAPRRRRFSILTGSGDDEELPLNAPQLVQETVRHCGWKRDVRRRGNAMAVCCRAFRTMMELSRCRSDRASTGNLVEDWHLDLSSPLVMENLLLTTVEFKVLSGHSCVVSGQLEPGRKREIYVNCDVGEGRLPQMLIIRPASIPQSDATMGWSSQIPIQQVEEEMGVGVPIEVPTTTRDPSTGKQLRSPLFLRMDARTRAPKSSSLHLTLYAPFWILNRLQAEVEFCSGRALLRHTVSSSFSQNKAGQEENPLSDFVDDAEIISDELRLTPGFITMFGPDPGMSSSKCTVRTTGSEWSKPVSLDLVGTSKIVGVRKEVKERKFGADDDTLVEMSLGTRLAPGKYGISRIIECWPRYLLVNKLPFDVEVQQLYCSARPLLLKADEIHPYHWPAGSVDAKRLRIRFVGAESQRWSGAVDIANVGSFGLKLPRVVEELRPGAMPEYCARVEVKMAGTSAAVLLCPESLASPPIMIQNLCADQNLRFSQKNVNVWTEVMASESRPFCLNEPMEKPFVIVQLLNSKGRPVGGKNMKKELRFGRGWMEIDAHHSVESFKMLGKLKCPDGRKIEFELMPDGPMKRLRAKFHGEESETANPDRLLTALEAKRISLRESITETKHRLAAMERQLDLARSGPSVSLDSPEPVKSRERKAMLLLTVDRALELSTTGADSALSVTIKCADMHISTGVVRHVQDPVWDEFFLLRLPLTVVHPSVAAAVAAGAPPTTVTCSCMAGGKEARLNGGRIIVLVHDRGGITGRKKVVAEGVVDANSLADESKHEMWIDLYAPAKRRPMLKKKKREAERESRAIVGRLRVSFQLLHTEVAQLTQAKAELEESLTTLGTRNDRLCDRIERIRPAAIARQRTREADKRSGKMYGGGTAAELTAFRRRFSRKLIPFTKKEKEHMEDVVEEAVEEEKAAEEAHTASQVRTVDLRVTVFGAKDLINADAYSLSDPYCVVSVDGQKNQTKTIQDNLNPEWNERYEYQGIQVGGGTQSIPCISFSTFDEDFGTDDDLLGRCTLPLELFLRRGSHWKKEEWKAPPEFATDGIKEEGEEEEELWAAFDGWVPLEMDGEKAGAAGSIHIRVEVTPTAFFSDKCRFMFSMDFAGFGISLCDLDPKELLYISATGLSASVKDTPDALEMSMNLRELQVCNQTEYARFPLMVCRTPKPRSHDVPPFFQLCCVLSHKEGSPNVLHFQYFSILLQEMNLALDEELLLETLRFLLNLPMPSGLGASQSPLDALGGAELLNSVPLPEGVTTEETLCMYFELLQLHPIRCNVSMLQTGKILDENGPIGAYLSHPLVKVFTALARTVGTLLTNIEDAPVLIRPLVLEHPFADAYGLSWLIIQHFIQQIMREFYRILGSLDFLGNPVGLLSGLGSGVKDFLYEPAEAIMMKPGDVHSALAKGTFSLLSHTTSGLFDATTKIGDTLGKGVALLSMDDEYLAQRQRISAKNRSLLSGASKLTSGVWAGMKGVIAQPIKGAKEGGAKGLLAGIGKGIVGLGVKSAVGVLDLATDTTAGLRDWNLGADTLAAPTRIRAPRALGPGGSLQVFSAYRAEGQQLFHTVLEARYARLQYEEHHMLQPSPGLKVAFFFSKTVFVALSCEPKRSLMSHVRNKKKSEAEFAADSSEAEKLKWKEMWCIPKFVVDLHRGVHVGLEELWFYQMSRQPLSKRLVELQHVPPTPEKEGEFAHELRFVGERLRASIARR